jgi:poly(hydroxyalkanoate) granule-associated protein
MATKSQETSEQPAKGEHRQPGSLFELWRKMLLASIGAMALAQDEVETLVNKLVERGEVAEKDGRKLLKELVEKRRQRFEGVEDEVNKRVQETLEHLNVPTKADVEALSEKIAALTKKIDELKKKA